jgi:hypothetical protein
MTYLRIGHLCHERGMGLCRIRYSPPVDGCFYYLCVDWGNNLSNSKMVKPSPIPNRSFRHYYDIIDKDRGISNSNNQRWKSNEY